MPVFPALYRHISNKREARRVAESKKSGPYSNKSWRTAFGTSSYVQRRANPSNSNSNSNSKGSTKGGDPYLLSMDEIEPPGFEESATTNRSEERDLESGMAVVVVGEGEGGRRQLL